jgi:hypothetical protein
MGGHGYAVVKATREMIETEFVCLPRPVEPKDAEMVAQYFIGSGIARDCGPVVTFRSLKRRSSKGIRSFLFEPHSLGKRDREGYYSRYRVRRFQDVGSFRAASEFYAQLRN